MKKTILALAIVGLLIGAPAVAGEHGIWVGDAGHAVELTGSHPMMLHEGGETFDLSELRDGETRDFGQGDKQITVTREGDDVLILREQSGEESALELKCDVNDDTCQVVTFSDDPEKVMIVVSKTRTCVSEDGDGECEADMNVFVQRLGELGELGELSELSKLGELGKLGDLGKLGELDHHAVMRIVKCDDDGNCEESEEILHGGMPFAGHADGVFADQITVVTGHHQMDDKVMLTCPEGDATVTVEKDEAEDTFLCPKHSVPMEAVKHANPFVRKIRIKQDD